MTTKHRYVGLACGLATSFLALVAVPGCGNKTSGVADAPAAPAATAPPLPVVTVTPKEQAEAMAQHNAVMKRQRDYWIKHGQGH